MAVLYITEYELLAVTANGNVPVGKEPAIATQALTYTGTSAASAAFNSRTKFVRLHTDGICSIIFAADPTATTSNPRMGANQTEYFGVDAGDKVAAIVNT